MDFESHMRCYWPAYWIGAIAITSIIWFAVHLVTSILNVEGKDEWEDMKIAYQVMMNIRDDNSQNMNITSKVRLNIESFRITIKIIHLN